VTESTHFHLPEYSHTQRGPLSLILYLLAAVCVVLGIYANGGPGLWISLLVGLLLGFLGASFQHLTVEDRGDRLGIRFGPLHLFRRSVKYQDISRVQVGRTSLLDGWGIHYSLRGGWVWNLWGFDCVEVHFRRGGKLMIGTDDPENLSRFLSRKIAG
jgi:hypothetical protein